MTQTPEIRDLSSLLDVVETEVERAHDGARHRPAKTRAVSMAAIMRALGQEAPGPLLLAVGLISISPATVVPGATWALAALTLLVALQIAMQRDRPWVPRRALRLKVSGDHLTGFIKAARPAATAVDRMVRPRWQFFAEQPWIMIIALMCAMAALITFPLGLVPFGPLVPGLAIVLFGLGLTARDGVLLAAGATVFAVGCWLVLASMI